jgi:phage/plasmid primase-like uncharacterized protein
MITVARAKAVRIESELARRGIRLKRAGRELVGPCPVCGGTDRFAIHLTKQIWNCRHCARGGDVIDLVQHLDGMSVIEAVKVLTGSGVPARAAATAHSTTRSTAHGEERDTLEAADRIWRQSNGILGSPGEIYFSQRGLDLDEAPDAGGLRWHPKCPWEGTIRPCVVARFTDALTNEPRGIWRRPVDGGKPKSLGPSRGCVIRLWPDENVTTGLVIGEGVETVLSAALHFTCRGTLLRPAWATSSAVHLENFPILSGIEALTILADHDVNGRGQEAAERCAKRWVEAGREVTKFTPRAPGDFNDAINPERRQ